MKKFKIAVAGCGEMANTWIQYALLRPDAEIVALVDIKPESAIQKKDKYQLACGVFDNITKAIRHSGANLVLDITPPENHKNIVLSSFAAGCDVLGEKPMASSLEDAQEMVKASAEYGKMYAVMQNRRYISKVRSFRKIITSGAIGQLGFICADFFLGPHFGGFRDKMDSPLLLDMAIHTFDMARFITGRNAISVYCHEFNPAGSWYRGNAAAVCIFEMDDGSVFCYRGSWCSEGAPTSWEAEWRISGSKGTAIWNGKDAPYYEVVLPSERNEFINNRFQRVEMPLEQIGQEGHFGCLDEMFAALIEGRKAETDCADNIRSMAMVFGAVESARRGKKILL